MKKLRFKANISLDEETGKLIAVYLRVREGVAEETVELEEDAAYADYDAEGQLLSVELLALSPEPNHWPSRQLHLLEQQASWSRFNVAVCGLRFFFSPVRRFPILGLPHRPAAPTMNTIVSIEITGRIESP